MENKKSKSVAIIVTNPDEATLWAGGTILSHPEWNCFVVCLTNAKNKEKIHSFYNALKLLKAEGVLGNLKSIEYNNAKDKNELDRTIIQLLPNTHFDIIISHNSFVNNPENKFRESINESIIKLWQEKHISADELWTFANENGDLKYYPNNIEQPEVLQRLSKRVWAQKNKIMTRIFGFNENSKETIDTTQTEAFWNYTESISPKKNHKKFGYDLNIFRSPNIEALKFLYHKSIAYVYDQNYWKIDESSEDAEIIGVEIESNSKYSYKKFGKELHIFKSASIENLKTLYYKSIYFLFDKNSWRTGINEQDYSFANVDISDSKKRRINRKVEELKIFKSSSIESLKSIYFTSMSFVFDHNKIENKVSTDSDTLNSEDSYIPSSIENLKRRYNSRNTQK